MSVAGDKYEELLDEIDRLKDDIELLRTAIMPFVEDCNSWPDDWPDNETSNTEFLFSELRAARDAWRRTTPKRP